MFRLCISIDSIHFSGLSISTHVQSLPTAYDLGRLGVYSLYHKVKCFRLFRPCSFNKIHRARAVLDDKINACFLIVIQQPTAERRRAK